MTLSRFRANNHPQQVDKHGARAAVDERATPPEFFDPLHAAFDFSIDVAALPHNAKCERFYTPDQDGLAQSWAGERVWCNPPYSSIEPWVAKAWAERDAELVVMLLPANRTEQRWWQDMVEMQRDRIDSPLSCRFVAGRQRFITSDDDQIRPDQRPPFGVCLLTWRHRWPFFAAVAPVQAAAYVARKRNDLTLW